MRAPLLSPFQILCNPWTVAHQAPLSVGFLQAKILEWVAIFLLRGIFPTQGLNLCFLCLLVLAGRFFTTEPPVCTHTCIPQLRPLRKPKSSSNTAAVNTQALRS